MAAGNVLVVLEPSETANALPGTRTPSSYDRAALIFAVARRFVAVLPVILQQHLRWCWVHPLTGDVTPTSLSLRNRLARIQACQAIV